MYGLSSKIIKDIQNSFSEIDKIEKVILYGSRAMGNYKDGSDIDITLLGENLTLKNSIYPLQDILEELYLPYSFDISIFENIQNEELKKHILDKGKVLYSKQN